MSDENALSTFNFDGQKPLHTILDDNRDPWFAAGDTCAVLGLSNVSQALARLDAEEKREIITNDVTGRQQAITFISESGLYSLILTSRKPEAKRFKKWITSEVLPAIRKAGQYTAQAMTPLQQLRATVETLEAQQAQLDNHEDRIERIEARQDAIQANTEHFSVMAYCKLKRLPSPTLAEAAAHGRRASALSAKLGYSVGKIPDQRFGEVNTYHISVLDQLFTKEGRS